MLSSAATTTVAAKDDKRVWKLLDLCCKAGGASMGYWGAAATLGIEMEITGIDKDPQPNYPFNFIQANAVDYLVLHGGEYDFIAASPPCQKHSGSTAMYRKKGKKYPCIIAPIRKLMLYELIPYMPDVETTITTWRNPYTAEMTDESSLLCRVRKINSDANLADAAKWIHQFLLTNKLTPFQGS